MPQQPLDPSELAALAAFDTPTICNALDFVAPGRRSTGFTTETLVCPFPDAAPMVGYARTATTRAMTPPAGDAAVLHRARLDYYRYMADGEVAKIVVVQDLDSSKGFGCWFGEVNSAIHKGLGCAGLITDGAVRDIPDWAPGFGVLCGKITPSHAWVHPVGFGEPVDVFGMTVCSGDLVHADRHGAVVIPRDVARDVAVAADLSHRREAPILAAARSTDFSIEALVQAWTDASGVR